MDALVKERKVRIFVDTNVDTHCIVLISHTSTVGELRELVKVTHRHCYPNNGDVTIDKLAVPGGEYKYHLADYFCIGDIFCEREGKVFAEVENYASATSNAQELCKLPLLDQKTSSTPAKNTLLPHSNNVLQLPENGAIQIPKSVPELGTDLDYHAAIEHTDQKVGRTIGEPGSILAVGSNLWELQKVLKVPKLQGEETNGGDANILLDSQLPLPQHIGRAGGLAGGNTEKRAEESEELVEKPSTVADTEGLKCFEADTSQKSVQSCKEGVIEESSRLDIKMGSRKREASDSSQGHSKSRRISEPAPNGSTLRESETLENGRLDIQYRAIQDSKNENMSIDALHRIVENGDRPPATSVSQVDPSGDLTASILSGSGNKRRRKKGSRNSDLTKIKDLIEAVKVERLQSEPKGDGFSRQQGVLAASNIHMNSSNALSSSFVSNTEMKKKKKRKMGIDSVNGLGVDESAVDVLGAAGEDNLDALIQGCEMLTAHENDQKNRKLKKRKNGITHYGTADTTPGHIEVTVEAEAEDAQIRVPEIPTVAADLVDHAGTARTSPNLEYPKDTRKDEEANVTDGMKKKKKNKNKRREMKKGSINAAPTASNLESLMGPEASGRPSVTNISNVEKAVNRSLQRGARIPTAVSDVDLDNTGAKAISHQVGAEFLPEINVAGDKPVERQESPGLSRLRFGNKAGRGASSWTPSPESFGDLQREIGNGDRDSGARTSHSHSSKGARLSKQESDKNLESAVSALRLLQNESERVTSNSADFLKSVARPGNVAHSSSSIEESSAESETKHDDQTQAENQQNSGGTKQGQKLEAPERSTRSPQSYGAFGKQSESEEGKINNDSLEFLSQDQSFHVAPTQVQKALSYPESEESDDESDIKALEGTENVNKEDTNVTYFPRNEDDSLRDSIDEGADSDTSSSTDSPSLPNRTPAPLVSRMRSSGDSQNIKRRASGVAADIEAKFAHFIDSQDGLDEIMGITLSQRKRSMSIESSMQARLLGVPSTRSPAATSGSPVDVVFNSQDSVRDNATHGVVVGSDDYSAMHTAKAYQKPAAKTSTAEFKVPKPVLTGTTSGARKAVVKSAETTLQLSRIGVSRISESKQPLLKERDSSQRINSETRRPDLEVEKVVPLVRGEVSSNEPLSDSVVKQGSDGLSLTPEDRKETILDDQNTGEEKHGAGKSSEKRKRFARKNEESQFMVVNNTDHLLEDASQSRKLRIGDEEVPTSVEVHLKTLEIQLGGDPKTVSGREERKTYHSEDVSLSASKKSGKNRKEGRVKRENVEVAIDGTPDMSGLESSGKKKKKRKKKRFSAEELMGKELNVLPETSMDRSARETEELYLKLEKAKRDLWLQDTVSSLKKEEVLPSGAPEIDGIEAARSEDVGQTQLEGGDSEGHEAGEENAEVMANMPLHQGSNGGDVHRSSHILAGSTAASDREEDFFLSQDKNFETAKKDHTKSDGDVFDYITEDEPPIKSGAKSAQKSEKRKAKHMDKVSNRAVERVLEDEMLHVADLNYVPNKKSRKDDKPKKWSVRMRGSLPSALAASSHDGAVSSMAAAINSTGDVFGKEGAQADQGVGMSTKQGTKIPKARTPKTKHSGVELCPVGCGKAYTGKTSAWYIHRKNCTGAPP